MAGRHAGAAGIGLAVVVVAAGLFRALPVRDRAHPPSSPHAGEAQIHDDAGRQLTAEEPPSRIVSLVPSLTETLLDLGAGDRLVARTGYVRRPELADLPSVGSTTTPDLEVLAAVRPDLVVWWADEGSPRVAERLRDDGVRIYAARVTDFRDLRRHVENLGALTGRRSAADSLLHRFDRNLARATVEVATAARPSVAFVVWPRPLSVAGPGTFADRIIHLAGATNVFADVRLPWPRPGPEALVARDPDILLFPVDQPATGISTSVLDGPPWTLLSAVREGRIIRMPSDLLERPTLRSPAAVRLLAERLRETAGAAVTAR